MFTFAIFVWLTRFIERHPVLHRLALAAWRLFPARLAGFVKGLLTRSWVVGVVAVLLDETVSPAEVLLAEHSYRRRGSWGLPGGSLEAVAGDPARPGREPSADDAIEAALRREVSEELGIGLDVHRLLRIDAIPYMAEEPGPYRLTFYYLCSPTGGFEALREDLATGESGHRSPEIRRIRFVPLPELDRYDLFSADRRFLTGDLPRLV